MPEKRLQRTREAYENVTVDTVTRLTVVDESGRAYERWGVHVELHQQDNGRTLKVFVTPRATNG